MLGAPNTYSSSVILRNNFQTRPTPYFLMTGDFSRKLLSACHTAAKFSFFWDLKHTFCAAGFNAFLLDGTLSCRRVCTRVLNLLRVFSIANFYEAFMNCLLRIKDNNTMPKLHYCLLCEPRQSKKNLPIDQWQYMAVVKSGRGARAISLVFISLSPMPHIIFQTKRRF